MHCTAVSDICQFSSHSAETVKLGLVETGLAIIPGAGRYCIKSNLLSPYFSEMLDVCSL